jgi:hypothetical protein
MNPRVGEIRGFRGKGGELSECMILEEMIVLGEIDEFLDIDTASPDKVVGGRRNRQEACLKKRIG